MERWKDKAYVDWFGQIVRALYTNRLRGVYKKVYRSPEHMVDTFLASHWYYFNETSDAVDPIELWQDLFARYAIKAIKVRKDLHAFTKAMVHLLIDLTSCLLRDGTGWHRASNRTAQKQQHHSNNHKSKHQKNQRRAIQLTNQQSRTILNQLHCAVGSSHRVTNLFKLHILRLNREAFRSMPIAGDKQLGSLVTPFRERPGDRTLRPRSRSFDGSLPRDRNRVFSLRVPPSDLNDDSSSSKPWLFRTNITLLVSCLTYFEMELFLGLEPHDILSYQQRAPTITPPPSPNIDSSARLRQIVMPFPLVSTPSPIDHTVSIYHLVANPQQNSYTSPYSNNNNSNTPPNTPMATLVSRFNVVSKWVVTEILSRRRRKDQTHTIDIFLRVGERCLALNNYNTLMAVLAGLNHSSVQRLRDAWGALHPSRLEMFTQFEMLMAPTRNFAKYRAAIATAPAPVLPYMGIYLKDVTFILEGNPSYTDDEKVDSQFVHLLYERFVELRNFQVQARPFFSNFTAISPPTLSSFCTLRSTNTSNLNGNGFTSLTMSSSSLSYSSSSSITHSPRSSHTFSHSQPLLTPRGTASPSSSSSGSSSSSSSPTIAGTSLSTASVLALIDDSSCETREVKAYVADLPYFDDEEMLHVLSLMREPNRHPTPRKCRDLTATSDTDSDAEGFVTWLPT
eukprot:TRINITY_DN1657_c0_g1_i1.p1 TRINITY_DN1657_c0_g1~~TRINITY_DN1657_c0_g1_i1.p1  ORF type:complete len:677 (-),score=107.05 TRINITY_DN1657_c0_g1_i1:100-2130(-)